MNSCTSRSCPIVPNPRAAWFRRVAGSPPPDLAAVLLGRLPGTVYHRSVQLETSSDGTRKQSREFLDLVEHAIDPWQRCVAIPMPPLLNGARMGARGRS